MISNNLKLSSRKVLIPKDGTLDSRHLQVCILKVLYQILNLDAHKVVIKQNYFYFAFPILVDRRL